MFFTKKKNTSFILFIIATLLIVFLVFYIIFFVIKNPINKDINDNLSLEKQEKTIQNQSIIKEVLEVNEKQLILAKTFQFRDSQPEDFKVFLIENNKECPVFINDFTLVPFKYKPISGDFLNLHISTKECVYGEIQTIIAQIIKDDQIIDEFKLDILADNLTQKRWLGRYRPSSEILSKIQGGEYRLFLQARNSKGEILDEIKTTFEFLIN